MGQSVQNGQIQIVQQVGKKDMFEVMEQAYKFSQIMAKSDIIPAHYRNKPANVFVATQTAYSTGQDPLLVMQNTFVIGGKLGMNSTFAISLANTSGLLASGIRYKVVGEGSALRVTAYATLKSNDEEISYTVGMKEAIAENWIKNPKYKSLPELMLRYRAATLLIRTHMPEVINGMHMVEELQDVQATKEQKPAVTAMSAADAFLEQAGVQDAGPELEPQVIESMSSDSDEDIHLKLARLVESEEIPQEIVDTWLAKAQVSDVMDLDETKTMLCIEKIESGMVNGANGHRVIGSNN